MPLPQFFELWLGAFFIIVELTMLTNEDKKRARVLLADDHAAVLEDLRALVESEFDVVGSVGDGHALFGAVEGLSPDVVVTDINMPGLDGIAAATKILRQRPDTRIIFVTVHGESEMVRRGLETGALGYVVKMSAGNDLLPAINAALQGKRYVSETIGEYQV
jgi:DNA-binding NarL/FixJ family response regulator